jgi:hypothetical protein
MTLDRVAFAIDRFWGREPGWYISLDRQMKLRLLADWRLHNESPKDAKMKATASKRRRWDKARKRYNAVAGE